MKRLVLLLLCALTASHADARIPRGSVGSQIPIPSVVGLHVSSNKILNSSGQNVPLRGVDKSGTEYECLGAGSNVVFDGPSDSSDISNMQSWAIDIVRIPLNEDCWLGINGQPAANYNAATYQSTIIAYVNALTTAGIASIIDLQWVGPGTVVANPNVGGGLLPLPDMDHAPAFWTSVANAFKSNSSVIFDLYNEPWPDNNQDSTTAWTCLRDGGTAAACSTNDGNSNPYTPVGMQSLINTVRATGATNIIDVPCVQFANACTQWLTFKPTDTLTPQQLNAAWHSYDSQPCNNTTCWNSVIQPVINSVPLIAEEIGDTSALCQNVYTDSITTWLDGASSNYLAWAWNVADCAGFPALLADYTVPSPTGFGISFRNHLLALYGRPVPPLPPVTFFSSTYPFGLAVGRSSAYTASDGTVYQPDPYIQTINGIFTVAPGLQENMQFYQPFTTADTITGTPDPTLYQTGRVGGVGYWYINVPNGNYTVTLGFATNSTYTFLTGLGPYGQDQVINGNGVGTCVGSYFSAPSTYLDFQNGITGGSGYTNGIYSNVALTGGTGSGAHATIIVAGGTVTNVITTTQGSGYTVGDVVHATIAGGTGFAATVEGIAFCPGTTTTPPTLDTAFTVSYNVSVFTQLLLIESAASNGGGRTSILNSIKVATNP